MVNSLHAMGPIPNARIPSLWSYYTELCTVVVIFASVSGVYLWAVRQRDKLAGTIILVGALVASLTLMFWVWKGGWG